MRLEIGLYQSANLYNVTVISQINLIDFQLSLEAHKIYYDLQFYVESNRGRGEKINIPEEPYRDNKALVTVDR